MKGDVQHCESNDIAMIMIHMDFIRKTIKKETKYESI